MSASTASKLYILFMPHAKLCLPQGLGGLVDFMFPVEVFTSMVSVLCPWDALPRHSVCLKHTSVPTSEIRYCASSAWQYGHMLCFEHRLTWRR